MTKWLIGLFVSFILVSSATFAQETPNREDEQGQIRFMKLPGMVDCSEPAMVDAFLSRYGEIQVAQAKSFIQTPDGTLLEGDLAFYANPETYSYSVVVQFDEIGLWCIVNTGTEFKPVTQGDVL